MRRLSPRCDRVVRGARVVVERRIVLSTCGCSLVRTAGTLGPAAATASAETTAFASSEKANTAAYLAKSEIWLPFLRTYRTMCLAPEPEFRQALQAIHDGWCGTLRRDNDLRHATGLRGCGIVHALAPAATSRPIVEQIASDVTRILNLPDVKQGLLAQDLMAVTTPQRDHNQTLRSQLESLAKFVRAADIKVE